MVSACDCDRILKCFITDGGKNLKKVTLVNRLRLFFYILNEEQCVAIIIFPPNLDTFVLLVLKNMLLFFDEQLVRIGILNMAFEQIKAFLKKMQSEPELKNEVVAASTADDVARIALKLGFEFSGDELLRMSGQKVDRVTVRKTDIPGEYN